MNPENLNGEDKLADCTLEEKRYPHGYIRCKDGKCISCNDGSWSEEDNPNLAEETGKIF